MNRELQNQVRSLFFLYFLVIFPSRFSFFFWLKFYAVHFFCMLIIWSSVAQQEFDHVDTIAIKCVCSHLSWCCNLFTILYFQQQNRREKKWEKKNEVEQVKRSFQDEPWQNIFLSLWLLNLRKQDFIWIGLDWMAVMPVCWMLHLLHFYCIDFIFFLVLVVRFELYSTQMPCIYARTHRLMSFIWLFNLIGCSVWCFILILFTKSSNIV